MRLKNRKTGEIGNLLYKPDNEEEHFVVVTPCPADMGIYKTLDELAEEWTDYEGPKEYWYIDPMVCGAYCTKIKKDEDLYNFNKQIGNDFETEEEAEKAVEKLKVYNKLKQKGFVFSGWYYSTEGQLVILADNHEFSETEPEDLTELFGDKIC